MKTLILKRVPFGKKNTLDEDKEYQLCGDMFGPVGTLKEWKTKCPDYKIEIVKDEENGKNTTN